MTQRNEEQIVFTKPILNIISSHIVHGRLPETFSLSSLGKKEQEYHLADGAMDGIAIYHMRDRSMSDEEYTQMVKAIQAASADDYEEADALFYETGKKITVVFAIDPLQQYIREHQSELNTQSLFNYSIHAIKDSQNIECVKFGLSIMEIFKIDQMGILLDFVRMLGLCDEFTLYAIFVLRQMENGNEEIFRMAKKVHGWGRIHAVDLIEPDSEEIRQWILMEGVHNNIMPAYSALTCFRKAEVEELLEGHLTKKEFRGVRDIIEALFDEHAVKGISRIEYNMGVIEDFLREAEEYAVEDDIDLIKGIKTYDEQGGFYEGRHFQQSDFYDDPISELCDKILLSLKDKEKRNQNSEDLHYYLFELGSSVVKEERYQFYDRDRKNHQWVWDGEWMRRFYDGAYDVLEIDYDEENERISNPRLIKGHSMGEWHKKILDGGIPVE